MPLDPTLVEAYRKRPDEKPAPLAVTLTPEAPSGGGVPAPAAPLPAELLQAYSKTKRGKASPPLPAFPLPAGVYGGAPSAREAPLPAGAGWNEPVATNLPKPAASAPVATNLPKPINYAPHGSPKLSKYLPSGIPGEVTYIGDEDLDDPYDKGLRELHKYEDSTGAELKAMHHLIVNEDNWPSDDAWSLIHRMPVEPKWTRPGRLKEPEFGTHEWELYHKTKQFTALERVAQTVSSSPTVQSLVRAIDAVDHAVAGKLRQPGMVYVEAKSQAQKEGESGLWATLSKLPDAVDAVSDLVQKKWEQKIGTFSVEYQTGELTGQDWEGGQRPQSVISVEQEADPSTQVYEVPMSTLRTAYPGKSERWYKVVKFAYDSSDIVFDLGALGTAVGAAKAGAKKVSRGAFLMKIERVATQQGADEKTLRAMLRDAGDLYDMGLQQKALPAVTGEGVRQARKVPNFARPDGTIDADALNASSLEDIRAFFGAEAAQGRNWGPAVASRVASDPGNSAYNLAAAVAHTHDPDPAIRKYAHRYFQQALQGVRDREQEALVKRWYDEWVASGEAIPKMTGEALPVEPKRLRTAAEVAGAPPPVPGEMLGRRLAGDMRAKMGDEAARLETIGRGANVDAIGSPAIAVERSVSSITDLPWRDMMPTPVEKSALYKQLRDQKALPDLPWTGQIVDEAPELPLDVDVAQLRARYDELAAQASTLGEQGVDTTPFLQQMQQLEGQIGEMRQAEIIRAAKTTGFDTTDPDNFWQVQDRVTQLYADAEAATAEGLDSTPLLEEAMRLDNQLGMFRDEGEAADWAWFLSEQAAGDEAVAPLSRKSKLPRVADVRTEKFYAVRVDKQAGVKRSNRVQKRSSGAYISNYAEPRKDNVNYHVWDNVPEERPADFNALADFLARYATNETYDVRVITGGGFGGDRVISVSGEEAIKGTYIISHAFNDALDRAIADVGDGFAVGDGLFVKLWKDEEGAIIWPPQFMRKLDNPFDPAKEPAAYRLREARNSAVEYRINKEAEEAGRGFRQELYQAFIDQQGPVKHALDEVADEIPEARQAIIKLTAIKGAPAHTKNLIIDARDKVYRRLDPKSGKDRQLSVSEKALLDDYLFAMRNLEIDSAKGPNWQAMAGVDGDLSAKALGDYARKYGSADFEAGGWVREAAENYWAVMHAQIERLVDRGVLAADDAERILKKNGRYVYREVIDFIDPMNTYDVAGKPISVTSSGLHRLSDEGTQRMLETRSDLLMRDVISRTEARVWRNEANRSGYDFAKASWTNGIMELPRVRFMKANGEQVLEEAREGWTKLKFMDEGEQKHFFIHDELAPSWISSDPLLSSRLREWVEWGSGAKFLREAATGSNPIFPLRNMPRDAGLLYLSDEAAKAGYSGSLPKFLKQYGEDVRAVASEVLHNGPLWKEYVSHGGGMETLSTSSKWRLPVGVRLERGKPKLGVASNAQLEHLYEDSAVDKVFEVLGWLGQKSEQVTRLAVYRRAKMMRKTPDQAAFLAATYLDFRQGGSVTKAFGAISPYFPAAVQAGRTVARAAKKNPTLFAYKVGNLAVTAASLYGINRTISDAFHAGESLDAVHPKERNNNWVLMLPIDPQVDEDGNEHFFYLKVAKDQTTRFIASLAEGVADESQAAARGKESHFAWDQLGAGVGDAFPFSESQLSGPAWQAWMGFKHNHDLYRNSDVWRDIRQIDPELEWVPSGSHATPEAYVKFGEAVSQMPLVGDSALASPERTRFAVEQFATRSNPFTHPLETMRGAGVLAVEELEALRVLPADDAHSLIDEMRKNPGLRAVIGVTDGKWRERRKMAELAQAENSKQRRVDLEYRAEFDEAVTTLARTVKASPSAKTRLADLRGHVREIVESLPEEDRQRYARRAKVLEKLAALPRWTVDFFDQWQHLPTPRAKAQSYFDAWMRLRRGADSDNPEVARKREAQLRDFTEAGGIMAPSGSVGFAVAMGELQKKTGYRMLRVDQLQDLTEDSLEDDEMELSKE